VFWQLSQQRWTSPLAFHLLHCCCLPPPATCCCLLHQLPSFDDIRWVSLLGSLMSMAYCIIAFAMSASVKPEPSVNYVPAAVPRSTVDRVMGIFNALTSILFAYGECCFW
jgi:hypothetical protein